VRCGPQVDLASPDAAETLAAGIRGADFVVSCLGNRRGEQPVVAKGTAAVMSAMAKSGVPRMAMISSMGIGDSGPQLRRGGFGGWIYTCLFATVLRHVKNDLSAAEELAIGDNNKRPAGVSCVVVRPAGLSDAPGDGSYQVARADGTVGTSVAREDLARFMLTLATDQTYDNSAVSVGGNAPRVYGKR